MSNLKINLGEEINRLNQLYRDLEILKVDPPGDTADEKSEQREKIATWLKKTNAEILSLNRILDDLEASEVTVPDLTSEEYNKINQALLALHKVIQREQTFNEIILTVTAILEGTNTLIGKL